MHAPEYLANDTNETYGLKEPTRVALLKSYGHGQQIEMDFDISLIKSGWEGDRTACRSEVDRFPSEFVSLVSASKALALKGY